MNGLNYLLGGAVSLVGPIVAAVLLQFWAIQQILWVDAVTFVIAAVPLVMIVIPSVRLKQEKSSFKEDFVEGLAFVKSTKGFLTLLVLATGLNFLLTPLSTLLPYFVKFDHFGDAPQLAFVGAFFQVGILAGGFLMSVFRGFRNRMVAIVLSIYVVFVGYALVAITPTGLFWFMAVASLVMTVCLPIANVSIQTIVQTVVPLKMQGRVGSVIGAVASAATPVGMIIAGPLAALAGTSTLFLGCAALGVALLTISWFFTDVKHVEKLSAPVDQGLATVTGAVDTVKKE